MQMKTTAELKLSLDEARGASVTIVPRSSDVRAQRSREANPHSALLLMRLLRGSRLALPVKGLREVCTEPGRTPMTAGVEPAGLTGHRREGEGGTMTLLII